MHERWFKCLYVDNRFRILLNMKIWIWIRNLHSTARIFGLRLENKVSFKWSKWILYAKTAWHKALSDNRNMTDGLTLFSGSLIRNLLWAGAWKITIRKQENKKKNPHPCPDRGIAQRPEWIHTLADEDEWGCKNDHRYIMAFSGIPEAD